MKKFLGFTGTMFLVLWSWGQESSQDYAVDSVVITGQYTPQSLDQAIHPIRTISAEKIERMAAVNLGDVLENELNIRLSQDNILGQSLSIQGLSGENVKILIDGVPVIGRQNGNIDLGQLNLLGIERIEVVEGPLSVNYGTQALAGTINLIT
ncbi:MAG: TonB-dependent receptor plug domain-containing protein, partial [Bacteroidota bacterium]